MGCVICERSGENVRFTLEMAHTECPYCGTELRMELTVVDTGIPCIMDDGRPGHKTNGVRTYRCPHCHKDWGNIHVPCKSGCSGAAAELFASLLVSVENE